MRSDCPWEIQMDETILIIEDEDTLRESLTRVFTREGYRITAVSSAEPAMALLKKAPFDLILTDIILPGITGIEFLKWTRQTLPDQVVVIMTAYASLETAVETLRSGAHDYIVKPILHEEIKQVVKNALQAGALRKENRWLRQQMGEACGLNRIIGQHPEILRIIARVKKIVETGSNVLLIGEIGTGKQLIAGAIHDVSPRADKAFISLNLGAVSPGLWEEKLFGKSESDTNDAVAAGQGLLEAADGGTIYLNGVELLPLALQSKLLDRLENRKARSTGNPDSIETDLPIITGSSLDLEDLVKTGRFQETLYRRLKAITLKIPPLRDRKEDTEPLARFFIQHFARQFGKTLPDIDPPVLAAFRKYDWPGNVRELRTILERAVLISKEPVIGLHHLPSLVTSCC